MLFLEIPGSVEVQALSYRFRRRDQDKLTGLHAEFAQLNRVYKKETFGQPACTAQILKEGSDLLHRNHGFSQTTGKNAVEESRVFKTAHVVILIRPPI
jgi:hypothetical protein